MSAQNSSAKRKRHIACVLVVTVFVISAMIFVACKGRYVFIVPGIAFVMLTMAAMGFLCQTCCELISRRWPKSVGFMRCVRIVRSYAGRGHAGNTSPLFDYSIEVDYDYVVEGRRYKGTRISFVEKGYNSWKEADHARRPLLQNKNVNVYYCPLIPSWSCIAHAQIRDIVIGVSAAVAMSAGALMFTLLAFYYLP